jgi:hypothetical protein
LQAHTTLPTGRPWKAFLGWLPTVVQVAGIGVIVATGVLCAVVYDRSYYDDACHHIPIAVDMARHWNPYYVDPRQPFVAHWFPGLAEAVVAVVIGVTRDIRTANATGILAFLGTLLVTWNAAALWTRDPRARISCLALVAATPVFLAQTTAFYNDIHVALLSSGGLYCIARCAVTRHAGFACGALAAIALVVGTKYYGLYYALVLTPAAAFCLCRSRAPRLPLAPLAAASACALFSAGFYVRNLLTRGNPIFPIHVPSGLRGLVRALPWVQVPYQELPDIFNSPATRFPHPYIPDAVTASLTPDLTAGAFGLAFPVGVALSLLSLFLVRRLPRRLRVAWLLTAGAAVALVSVFPFHLDIPRYLCVVAVVVSLAPAVLERAGRRMGGDGSRRSRPAAAWAVNACAAVALWTFVWPNVLAAPEGARGAWATVHGAYRAGRAIQMTQIPLPAPGHHLRLGYVGGFNNFVSLLYDDRFTNELVPLYYRPSPFHALPAGPADERAFVDEVNGLKLDGIHVFHRKNPAASLVTKYFGERVF